MTSLAICQNLVKSIKMSSLIANIDNQKKVEETKTQSKLPPPHDNEFDLSLESDQNSLNLTNTGKDANVEVNIIEVLTSLKL